MLGIMDHLEIGVKDLKEATEFYTEKLGFSIEAAWPNHVVVQLLPGMALLVLRGGAKEGEIMGIDHMSFLVDDVDKAFKELKEKGIEVWFEPDTFRSGRRCAGFRDPNGVGFEITKVVKEPEEGKPY